MTDYTEVTEVPGSRATRDQVARLYHRYHLAAGYAAGRRVLEIACGSGQGLGYLKTGAKSVVAGDYTEHLLGVAHAHYRDRMPLVRLDGQRLPFADGAFDLVILFEAIYYLQDAGRFAAESRRVLAEGGTLIVGTVNREWLDFAPSPLNTRYLSLQELGDLMRRHGFAEVQFFGAFPTAATSLKQRVVSLVRRFVVAFGLMPKTLAGRERFKRIFYGSLFTLGPEVSDGVVDLEPTEPLAPNGPRIDFKILYAVATC